jgi:hypothetical protein
MELVLTVLALASFFAMIGAWAAVPHPGREPQAEHLAAERGPVQVVGVH